MPDYSRKKFNHIKLLSPKDGCLLLASDEDASVFWSYDDDAIAISRYLDFKYSISKKGPVVSVNRVDLSGCRLVEAEEKNGAYYVFFDETIRKESCDLWEKENNKLPESALLRAKVRCGGEIRSIIIVSDFRQQNSTSDIYWEGRSISIKLITALHMGTRLFTYKEKSFFILRVYYTAEYFENTEKRFHFLDAGSEPKTIFVTNLMHFDNKEKYEPITTLFYYAGSASPAEMTVYYSKDVEEYYIDMPTYEQFRYKYGLPYVKLAQSSEKHYYGKTELADQSELTLYGYNVKQNGMTAEERQKLLSQLIDNGIMNKEKIRDHLSWLIHYSESNPNMNEAIKKWKEDLVFLNSYHGKDQKTIWASGFKAKGGA